MLTNWARAAGFVTVLSVALAGSLHWALYYPPTSLLDQSNIGTPNKETPTERGLLYFTGTLALATIGLMVATVGLVSLANRQAKDARIAQRAYVYVRSPQSQLIFDHALNLVALRVWVVWKNSGTTPAGPMFSNIVATWTPDAASFQFGAITNDKNSVSQPMVMGPDAELNSGTIDIGGAHVMAVVAGTGHQFLSGWARFKDAFPDSPEHVIEFCYKVSIQGTPSSTAGECVINFNLYGDHNRYYDNPAA
jgi:hypothetical protein